MNTPKNKLPEKASQLIRLAIKDLIEAEKDQGYEIEMSTWHGYDRASRKCYICLAGAVMRGSLKIPFRCSSAPYNLTISEHDKRRLSALDAFREGRIYGGLLDMNKNCNIFASSIDVTPYEENPALFKADMLKMAHLLEEAGL